MADHSSGPVGPAVQATKHLPISVGAAGHVAVPQGQAAYIPRKLAQNGVPDAAYLMQQRAEAQYGVNTKRTMLSLQASLLHAPRSIAAAVSKGAIESGLGPVPSEPLSLHVFNFAVQQCMQPLQFYTQLPVHLNA